MGNPDLDWGCSAEKRDFNIYFQASSSGANMVGMANMVVLVFLFSS